MIPPAGIAVLAMSAAISQQTIPRATLNGTAIEVTFPPNIFRNEQLTKSLTSGLTTTILIFGDDPSGRMVRIEIRDDLWDELFRVNVFDVAMKQEQLTFPTIARLREWLETTRFHVADVHDTHVAAMMRIEVDVVPFSATEQAEAQRWLLHSIRDAEAQSPGAGGSRTTSSDSGSAFDRLIAGSVKPKAVLSWHWKIPVPRP